MKRLSDTWLTEGWVDFEYKKYILLAYLDHVRGKFDKKKLYPFLADLISHHKNLISFKQNKAVLNSAFPKELSKETIKGFRLRYKDIINDDGLIKELDEIVDFSLDKIGGHLSKGKEIYDMVESKMDIEEIGLSSLYKDEGFFFLNFALTRDCKAYRYKISVIESPEDKFRIVNTCYLGDFSWSISYSFENIKSDIRREYNELATAPFYLIKSEIPVPEKETFLPLAKRLLVRYLFINK